MNAEAAIVDYETHDQGVGCIVCWFAGTLPREQLGRPAGWWAVPCPVCGSQQMIVTEPVPLALEVELPFERLPPFIHPSDLVEDYIASVMKRRNRGAR